MSNPAVISTNVSRLFYAEFSIDMTARAASYKMHLCHDASLIFRITIIVQFFSRFFLNFISRQRSPISQWSIIIDLIWKSNVHIWVPMLTIRSHFGCWGLVSHITHLLHNHYCAIFPRFSLNFISRQRSPTSQWTEIEYPIWKTRTVFFTKYEINQVA